VSRACFAGFGATIYALATILVGVNDVYILPRITSSPPIKVYNGRLFIISLRWSMDDA